MLEILVDIFLKRQMLELQFVMKHVLFKLPAQISLN